MKSSYLNLLMESVVGYVFSYYYSIQSTVECFVAVIKDGQLLLVFGPNSFGSNYG